jgi:hypothetical protein
MNFENKTKQGVIDKSNEIVEKCYLNTMKTYDTDSNMVLLYSKDPIEVTSCGLKVNFEYEHSEFFSKVPGETRFMYLFPSKAILQLMFKDGKSVNFEQYKKIFLSMGLMIPYEDDIYIPFPPKDALMKRSMNGDVMVVFGTSVALVERETQDEDEKEFKEKVGKMEVKMKSDTVDDLILVEQNNDLSAREKLFTKYMLLMGKSLGILANDWIAKHLEDYERCTFKFWKGEYLRKSPNLESRKTTRIGIFLSAGIPFLVWGDFEEKHFSKFVKSKTKTVVHFLSFEELGYCLRDSGCQDLVGDEVFDGMIYISYSSFENYWDSMTGIALTLIEGKDLKTCYTDFNKISEIVHRSPSTVTKIMTDESRDMIFDKYNL